MVAPEPRGFTLAEMVVVVAIIGIVSILVILGQGNFNRDLLVTDTAYTIAMSIREAQTFGLSSRTSGGAANAGYGVHVDSRVPQSYLLFADVSNTAPKPSNCPTGTPGKPDAKPGNCLYDAAGSELVQTFTFGRGFTITQVCGRDSSGLHCSTDGTGPLRVLDIVYIRPNTTSVMTGFSDSSTYRFTSAGIRVSAPTGGDRYVCVNKAGQVAVSRTICP